MISRIAIKHKYLFLVSISFCAQLNGFKHCNLTYSSTCIQLNGFKYCYVIVTFNLILIIYWLTVKLFQV